MRLAANLHLRWPASWMRADSVTCVKAAGADDAAAAANAWGSEKVLMNASMFFMAIFLETSMFKLLELPCVDVPTSETSSVLHMKLQNFKY